jgi:hypothetical protein
MRTLGVSESPTVALDRPRICRSRPANLASPNALSGEVSGRAGVCHEAGRALPRGGGGGGGVTAPPCGTSAHAHARARTHTHSRPRARAQTHEHTHALAHARAQAHAPTRTHARARSPGRRRSDSKPSGRDNQGRVVVLRRLCIRAGSSATTLRRGHAAVMPAPALVESTSIEWRA